MDNSKETTGNTEENKYACANTNDKVFALSYKDTTIYWETTSYENDETRIKVPTAYAKARGVYKSSDTNGCWWWLRSPSADDSYNASNVNYNGSIDYGGVYNGQEGVVPALQIAL